MGNAKSRARYPYVTISADMPANLPPISEDNPVYVMIIPGPGSQSVQEPESDQLDGFILAKRNAQIRGFPESAQGSYKWNMNNLTLATLLACRFALRGDMRDYEEAKSLGKTLPKGSLDPAFDAVLSGYLGLMESGAKLAEQLRESHPQGTISTTPPSTSYTIPSASNSNTQKIISVYQKEGPAVERGDSQRHIHGSTMSPGGHSQPEVTHSQQAGGVGDVPVDTTVAEFREYAKISTERVQLLEIIQSLLDNLNNSASPEEYTRACSSLTYNYYALFQHSSDLAHFEEAFEYAYTTTFLLSDLCSEIGPPYVEEWSAVLVFYLDYRDSHPSELRSWSRKWQMFELQKLYQSLSNSHGNDRRQIDSLADLQFYQYLETLDFSDGQTAIESYQKILDGESSTQTSISPTLYLRLGTLLGIRYMLYQDSIDFNAATEILQRVGYSDAPDSTEALEVLANLHYLHGRTDGFGCWKRDKQMIEKYLKLAITKCSNLSSSIPVRKRLAEFYIQCFYIGWGQLRENLIAALDLLNAMVDDIGETSPLFPDIALLLAQTNGLLHSVSSTKKSKKKELGEKEEGLGESVFWYRKYADASGARELELTEHERLHSLEGKRESARRASPLQAPYERLVHARDWATLALQKGLPECLEAFAIVTSLINDAIAIGNKIEDKYLSIRQLRRYGASAAAAVLKFGESPTLAVEYLEQSLSVAHRQLLQLRRGDIRGLAEKHPNLAERLNSLSSALKELSLTRTNDVASAQKINFSGTDNFNLRTEYMELLDEIRTRPGFESIFLPHQFSVLAAASKDGPVVMISNDYITDTTHALIVIRCDTQPVSLQLPGVSFNDIRAHHNGLMRLLEQHKAVQRQPAEANGRTGRPAKWPADPRARGFEAILEWAWIKIVQPVFEELEKIGIKSGRVWWCPAGEFAQLPLHAAPPFDSPYICSYTYTLEALMDAREQMSIPGPDAFRMSVVGVTECTGHPLLSLPYVKREIQALSEIVSQCPVIQMTKIEDGEAQVETVLAAIKSSQILHLSCHGYQDPQAPLNSRIILSDGNLQLRKILAEELPTATFAFLSACQTATGDVMYLNESVHLAGGFMAAGFKGVIGTMWGIADEDAPMVSREVYSAMVTQEGLDITKAAEGLRNAVRKMREADMPPHRWAPFIHVGI